MSWLHTDFDTICRCAPATGTDCFVHRRRLAIDAALTILAALCAEAGAGAHEKKGWRPVVAPELEFYLTQVNADPDCRACRRSAAQAGRRARPSPMAESITEYEDLIEHIYADGRNGGAGYRHADP